MDDTDEPTTWVPPVVSCPLCKCDTISSLVSHSLLEEEQDAGSGTGNLIQRNVIDLFHLTDDQRSQEVTVHDYCWSITRRVFKKYSVDQTWIDDFKDHIHFLHPFLTEAPFGSKHEASSLDHDIFSIVKSADHKMGSRNRFYIPLPPEVIHMIYDFLVDDDDVVNLSKVLHIGPCPKQWKYLAAKYMLADDLDPKANMSTLIENLQQMPRSRYPKTVNYRTIWNNMELVRDVMAHPTMWDELSATAPVTHHMTLENNGDSSRFAIRLPGYSKLVFIFEKSDIVQYLCGIVLNGLLIGHEEGTWSCVSVNSLRGLRVASTKDSFVGIQVKDADSWEGQWLGGCPPEGSHTQIQLEWNSSDCDLVVSYNILPRDTESIRLEDEIGGVSSSQSPEDELVRATRRILKVM
ncbi:hypothetical protein PENNAL_c0119G10525 [Penicillium nalgiovense]|uniref:Uncharacterized protein n=1 Tax=Penicillium nalgiovense TaxID=60175 RepID=A0A1V6X4Z7_PENNA|nr:hypothetical protein PENNAL_c0119G10525 [Penicillium nalgiovense]